MFVQMSKLLQEKEVGQYKIKHLVVSDEEAKHQRQMSLFSSSGGYGQEYRGFTGGIYTQLFNGQILEMSDTPMEQRTNKEFIERATGHVLIGGLGLGMILISLEKKEEVESITVIEISQEIIDLVWSQLNLKKTKVIQSDIFKYQTDQQFDTIYFDIWPEISGDNYLKMVELYDRYRNNLTFEGWISSWRYLDALANSEEYGCTQCWGNGCCQYCAGDGMCQDCEGEGEYEGIECDSCYGNGECLECDGLGDCSDCEGHGHTNMDEYLIDEEG